MTGSGRKKEKEAFENLIAGRRPVIEALRRAGVTGLFLQQGQKGEAVDTICSLARSGKVPCRIVSRDDLNRMLDGRVNHQGVVAVARPFAYLSLPRLIEQAFGKSQAPFLLMLDHLEDPHNFGSIIRTADAAGVHGIIIPGDRSVQVTPAVRKVAAGAAERVPIARVSNLARSIGILKREGFWVYGSDAGGESPFNKADYGPPLILVIGSEGRGLAPLIRRHCDRILSIPLAGDAVSLNASVAAALLIYAAVAAREGW